jgi:hypothetical protein
MLELRAPGVSAALDTARPHATDFGTLIARWTQAADGSPGPTAPGYEQPLTQAQADALRGVVAKVDALCAQIVSPTYMSAFVPVPSPELRVRPSL